MRIISILFLASISCSIWAKDSLPFLVTNDDEIWVTSFDGFPKSMLKKINSAETPRTDFSWSLKKLKAIYGINKNGVNVWRGKIITTYKLGVVTLWKHKDISTKGDCHNYPNTYISIKLIGNQNQLSGPGIVIPEKMIQAKTIAGFERLSLINHGLPALKKMYPDYNNVDMIANPEQTILDRTTLFFYRNKPYYVVRYRDDGFDVFRKEASNLKHLQAVTDVPCGS